MKNYQNIQKLIEAWDTFENDSGSTNFQEFGVWLAMKNQPTAPVSPWLEEQPDNVQLKALIFRISRIFELYMKVLFAQSTLKYADFRLLLSVLDMGNPQKKEVIDSNLMEITTGTTSLNKLLSEQMLEETEDPADKRAKRLKITEKGKQYLIDKQKELSVIVPMFNATLSKSDTKLLVNQLQLLNHFHAQMLQKLTETNDFERTKAFFTGEH